jgi:hypothetical protein
MITMQVRVAIFFIAAACGPATARGWQQAVSNKPSVAVLLARLHSQDDVERSTAFEGLRSNPAALQSPDVRAALLDLLDRENQELDAKLLQAQNSSQEDKGDAVDEGYAEYYSNVLGAVDSFADWNDPRQACILVSAGSSPDSTFATEVARHGKTTIPCLIRRSQSEVDANRSVAVPMLVQALATQKNNLDSGTVETARQTILKALRDPHVMLRSFTVTALSTFGEADMIPMLKDVAKTDPEFSKESNSYWIRVAANKAVAAIQKRAVAAPPTVTPHR